MDVPRFLTLIARPQGVNRYRLVGFDATSLLGTFDSHPEARIVAQAIANRTQLPVRLQLGDVAVSSDGVFLPEHPGASRRVIRA